LYQNIDLRLSQEAVDRSMKKLFGLPVAPGTTNNFKEEAAEKYQISTVRTFQSGRKNPHRHFLVLKGYE
jgi:hypothetical protein